MDGAGAEEEEEKKKKKELQQERATTGLEREAKEEDLSLEAERFVVDADADRGHGTRSGVLPASQINEEAEDTSGQEDRISPGKKVEEGGRYCALQATGSAYQDSVVLDSQLDHALVRGRPPNVLSDRKAVTPLSVAELAQGPEGQSGPHEQHERCSSDGVEKEAKKKKGNDGSGMCAEKASSGTPGDRCRQDVCGPATHRSSRCASASAVVQQSYKVPPVLEPRSGHDGIKGKKELLENPQILPPVRKKSRTFYSAEQLEELEKMFQEDHYPDNEKRREIAAVVGVAPQRVLVWFQNRRAKWRKLKKLSVKGNKKYPTSSALSAPFRSDDYGAQLLPVPPLPDAAHDQSAVLGVDATAGSYSSLLSGLPPPPDSSSAPPAAPCEAVETKALPRLGSGSSRAGEECCFPAFPSPPPVRRASLPLGLLLDPDNRIAPLMLDAPDSDCGLSGRENSSREAFAYSIRNHGLGSPVSCNYPEQLELAGNLETAYSHYSNLAGIYQLPQYPQQHQLSQFHHLPGHLASNVLSGLGLAPTPSTESHTAFLTLPGDGGVINCGAAGATQGYVQSHMEGQPSLEQPSGNSAGTSAYPAFPGNDFYVQGAPFLNQLQSRMPFSSAAGGQYFPEQVSYAQPP